jgi:hypothetical protein
MRNGGSGPRTSGGPNPARDLEVHRIKLHAEEHGLAGHRPDLVAASHGIGKQCPTKLDQRIHLADARVASEKGRSFGRSR